MGYHELRRSHEAMSCTNFGNAFVPWLGVYDIEMLNYRHSCSWRELDTADQIGLACFRADFQMTMSQH